MSRAHSALCGTAIRIAECMGLHRDGTEYGLSPVETHVRRLIWYQLCFLDLRTCEAQGPRPGIRKDEYDTQFPLNVDDVDLEKYPPARKSSDRWTDMTLSLIRMEVNEMHRVVWVDRVRLEKKKTSLTAILAKVEKFQRDMKEKYLPMIDERVPIQHYGRLLLDVLYYRMHIMILHRYHNSVSTRIPDRLRQIILTSGTQQLEDSIEMATSPMLQPWSWYVGAIQQWHTAFLLLIEVFAYPMRREADRIWACLDYVFEVPATLTRDQKARLILTELRDKTGAYRDLRKMRAPNGMIERLGQRPPRTAEDVALSQDRNGPQARHTSESAGSDASITGAANGESLFTPHATATSPAGSSETSNAAAAAAVAQSGPMKVREDMMIDIDWVRSSPSLLVVSLILLTTVLTKPERMGQTLPARHQHRRTQPPTRIRPTATGPIFIFSLNRIRHPPRPQSCRRPALATAQRFRPLVIVTICLALYQELPHIAMCRRCN